MNAPAAHDQHSILTGKAALASVAVAILLITLKSYASWSTGSVAMLGSLADSALDLVASLVTLTAVRYAAQPADAKHRFGHGKAEALSALFQVMLITASALLIGWRAILHLQDGKTTQAPEYGIVVSAIAIVATLALLTYQRSVLKRTGSLAIQADHLHYQSDLLLNLAVIAALVLDAVLNVRGADPVFGFGIALWLLWNAWQSGSDAFDHLMDHEWPDDQKEAFMAVIHNHPMMRGVHDLRTRSAGNRDFAQFHVWFDPQKPLGEVHAIMDEVEMELKREFPNVEVIIHPEPQNQIKDHELEHEQKLH